MPDCLVVVPLRWDNYELDFSLEKVNCLQIQIQIPAPSNCTFVSLPPFAHPMLLRELRSLRNKTKADLIMPDLSMTP